MHFGDYIFIFFLALVLFGPKRLPEIARQVGKLMMEFRRASNEFKLQMEDELRTMEQQERQKKLEAAAQQAQQAQPAPQPAEPSPAITADAIPETAAAEPTILPPSQGSPVSTEAPFTRTASHSEANDPPAQPESDAAIHHA